MNCLALKTIVLCCVISLTCQQRLLTEEGKSNIHNVHSSPHKPPSGHEHLSRYQLFNLLDTKVSLNNAMHKVYAGHDHNNDFSTVQEGLDDLIFDAKPALDSFLENCHGVNIDYNRAGIMNYVIVGHNCYTFHDDPITWKTARQECLKRGGHLAVPELGHGSTWGQDIFTAFGADFVGSVIWLGGLSEGGYMFLEPSGFEIPLDHIKWYSQNLGLQSGDPQLDEDEGLVLLETDAEDWYISFRDYDDWYIRCNYICEYDSVIHDDDEPENHTMDDR